MLLFGFLARCARERNVSSEELFLGTEASQSCPALLPFTWNVNKPARETKPQLRTSRGPGREAGYGGAHRVCPSCPVTSCSPEWSPLSHTSRPCLSSCSCFSRGGKKNGTETQVSQSCRCARTSGPGEWHEYLIPSHSQSPRALAGCLCLLLNVAHKVFLVTLGSKSLAEGKILRHNLTCLWGCYLQTDKHTKAIENSLFF